jgi:hypothetical protein
VALYLEEHEPSLRAAILERRDIGAAEIRQRPSTPPAIIGAWWSGRSRAAAPYGGAMSAKKIMQRYAVVFTGAAAFALLMRSSVRNSSVRRLGAARAVEAGLRRQPAAINVQPGDASVPKGSDRAITANLPAVRATSAVDAVRCGRGDSSACRSWRRSVHDLRRHAVRPEEPIDTTSKPTA